MHTHKKGGERKQKNFCVVNKTLNPIKEDGTNTYKNPPLPLFFFFLFCDVDPDAKIAMLFLQKNSPPSVPFFDNMWISVAATLKKTQHIHV